MIWVHMIECHNHFVKNDVILKLLEAPESWVQIPDIFLPVTSQILCAFNDRTTSIGALDPT